MPYVSPLSTVFIQNGNCIDTVYPPPGALYTKRISMLDKLLGLQNQLRIFHWQTASYSEHKALGNAYESLDELIDTFIETWMGATGEKVKAGFKITMIDYKNKSATDLLNQAYTFMTGELEETLKGRSELLNIRDEMLAVVQKTRYLLTLG